MKYVVCIFILTLFTAATPHKIVEIDAYSSATTINISLNNGEKWQADKVTKSGIEEMKNTLQKHIDAPQFEAEEVKLTLETQLASLLKNTTMEGDARTQLHNYQLAFRYRVHAIINHKSTLKEVHAYLDTFYTYFE